MMSAMMCPMPGDSRAWAEVTGPRGQPHRPAANALRWPHGDHNDIRDGVREAARHPIGSPKWWDGVWQARRANSDHMAEEEDDALADFRRNTPLSVREDLGRQFSEFKTNHAGAQGIDTDDKDPEGYVSAVQAEIAKMRDLTDKPFGVNIAQLFVRDPAIVDFVAEHDVRFVTTSAGDPTKFTRALKDAGITVFHVVPSLRGALKAVDADVRDLGDRAGRQASVGECARQPFLRQDIPEVDQHWRRHSLLHGGKIQVPELVPFGHDDGHVCAMDGAERAFVIAHR